MFYVLSPPDRTNWRLDRDRLREMLERDWPGARLGSEPEFHPTRDLTWKVRIGHQELEGSQDIAGQAQYLDGPLDLIAQYASWLRSKVDAQQALVLYDESYTTVVPLTPGIRPEEVLNRLTA